MNTLQEYIQQMRQALQYPGAHAFYFPPDAADRRIQNLRLAREIGPALVAYDPKEVADVLPALYGILIVAQSLDVTGVAIDNKPWVAEICASMADWRGRASTPPPPELLSPAQR